MFVALFINSHLDKPLGITPDEFRFKCGASSNTKATNKTNKDISEKTNELNYKIWQEQKDYDYQKWKENNAYNTPAEQRKRFEEAGLNPNLIAQQIGSGSSDTPASSGTAPVMSAAQMQNPADEVSAYADTLNNIAGGFNNMADTFSQNQLRSAQARESSTDADIKQVELTYRSAQLEAYINGLKKKGLLDVEQARSLHIQNEVDEASIEADKSRRRYEAENAEKTGRVLDSQQALNLAVKVKTDLDNELTKKYGDRKARLEISKLGSEIAVNYANASLAGASTELVRKQAETEVARKLQVMAETGQIKANTKQIEDLSKHLVNKAASEADRAAWEADAAYSRSYRERENNEQDFGSSSGKLAHRTRRWILGGN